MGYLSFNIGRFEYLAIICWGMTGNLGVVWGAGKRKSGRNTLVCMISEVVIVMSTLA